MKKKRVAWNKGIKCPQTSGVKNGMWKGEKAGYHAIHAWLTRIYGLAKLCDNDNCLGKSTSFEWALIKGKKYSRKRKNFRQLCQSCHRKYDFTLKEYNFAKTRPRNKNGVFIKLKK